MSEIWNTLQFMMPQLLVYHNFTMAFVLKLLPVQGFISLCSMRPLIFSASLESIFVGVFFYFPREISGHESEMFQHMALTFICKEGQGISSFRLHAVP